jgi:hypothetical protein
LKFAGYASVTDTPYDMGWYREVVKRGAFSKTLQGKPDVVLNVSHGGAASGLPIARTTAGTLRLVEDETGLRVDADLDDDDPDVALVSRKMKRGDLDGQMSFAFRVPAGRDSWSKDFAEREIHEADLRGGDVSIVVNGANGSTFSAMRAQTGLAVRSATLVDRRQMAPTVSRNLVVLECRSFSLDGQQYDMRTPEGDDPCNRCQGEGSIVLKGLMVPCPQCGGDGGSSGNAKFPAEQGDGEALSRLFSQLSWSNTRRHRAELELYREPPTHEQLAKYTAAEIAALGAKGHAFKNSSGSYSFPVADVEDLKNAIRAVGRGSADHSAIRLYIIGRARALGQLDLIPDTWDQSTGKLRAA